ncbi:MAG: MFS transporter [candidate division Zixibacteria bacterium]|nr:MFS transporter [candidate division Zixibacteria bacterium]
MIKYTQNNGPSEKSGLKFILRALGSRNYRLYFAGQGISLIGTWMQRIAQSWLVYRLTDSVFLLGIVGFSTQIPTFLVAPFAGVLVDNKNRYRILLASQIFAAIQAFILAILVLTNTVKVWHIIVLGVVLGIINAFDMPSRQSLIVEMIENRDDLSNAIALNSTMVNGARLVGPTIAGLLIAAVGEGICFLLNALSFLAVIAALLAMKLNLPPVQKKGIAMLSNLKEGFKYAFGFPPIRAILLLLALVSIMGMPYTVLMPIFARDILRGGPHTMGFLMGSVGVGALIGAIYLASRKSVIGLTKVLVFAASLFGTGLVLFSLSRNLFLSIVLLLFVGMGMMLQMATSNTLLQTLVDDDKRGRVLSFYNMSFFGMAPLGSFLAGSLASKIGTPATVAFGGITCIIGAIIFLKSLPQLRKSMRPIYVRKGIIPEVAEGLQAAANISNRPQN